jgi:hypothetical protein
MFGELWIKLDNFFFFVFGKHYMGLSRFEIWNGLGLKKYRVKIDLT